MPYAISIGVDLGSFWGLTPHTLGLIAKGYEIALKRQIEHENAIAHLQGKYFREAILSTVCNQLSDKSSKKYDYPQKPYDMDLDNDTTERERESQLQLFAGQLTTAMNNFNLSKEQG